MKRGLSHPNNSYLNWGVPRYNKKHPRDMHVRFSGGAVDYVYDLNGRRRIVCQEMRDGN